MLKEAKQPSTIYEFSFAEASSTSFCSPLGALKKRATAPHTNTDTHRLSTTQIFIKTLTGRKQAMTFEPTDEVLQIKRQLQEKEGIQVDQIRLIYSGKQLADDKTIESYQIAAGGTIHMVLQLRGGAC